jgi:long-chain acyl-CoA synthetase
MLSHMRARKNLGDLSDRGRDLHRTAIVDLHDPDLPRRYSHFDIDQLAGGVARFLLSKGLTRGQRIAIASASRAEYVAAYFGIMRAGMVAVPVNIKLALPTIQHILRDADVQLAFVDAERALLLPEDVRHVSFDEVGSAGFASVVTPSGFESVCADEGEIAQILYTSGSTGLPKGVPLDHRGQLHALGTSVLSLTPEVDRYLLAQPLYHMNGLMVLKTVFVTNAYVVLTPSFNARQYLNLLSTHRVTLCRAVPTMIARVIKELEQTPDVDLSALKAVNLSSAPLTQALVDRIRAAIPHVRVTNSYGTTEGGPAVFGPHPLGFATPDLSVGYPLPTAEVRLGPGTAANSGVLAVRNPAVMGGYLGLPEKTAAVLDDGWYTTGDVMRRDEEGFFFFVGRADDMFVCSGENVYPGEVEKMLERHPLVREACVLPLPDDERGQVPVAFIVTRPDTTLSFDDIKTHALEQGPAYQYPRRVAILPHLPWAGTNKIDRAALLVLAREYEATAAWRVGSVKEFES